MEQYLNERGDGWGSQSDLPLFMGTKKRESQIEQFRIG